MESLQKNVEACVDGGLSNPDHELFDCQIIKYQYQSFAVPIESSACVLTVVQSIEPALTTDGESMLFGSDKLNLKTSVDPDIRPVRFHRRKRVYSLRSHNYLLENEPLAQFVRTDRRCLIPFPKRQFLSA